jgi:HSP20 family protein
MNRNFIDLINEFENLFGKDSFSNYDFKNNLGSTKIFRVGDNLVSTNIFEDEWVYKYEIITPGLTKQDLNIEISGDKLIFSGERKQDKTEKGEYISKEYHWSKFYRVFEVPSNVVSEEIFAKTENGITTIFLPKEKPTKTKSYKRKVKID